MTRPQKVYLAGPMRGYPNFNFQAFEDAATALETRGYEVESPHDFDIIQERVTILGAFTEGRFIFDQVDLAPGFDIEQTLCDDFKLLLDCDGIVMLPGWDVSDGACKERKVAKWAGKQLGEWNPTMQRVTWKKKGKH